MLPLIGIFIVVVVALLSNKEQSKGAWLLAAVVIVLVIIADRIQPRHQKRSSRMSELSPKSGRPGFSE
jgi:predicted PurR-regulated permease PerM